MPYDLAGEKKCGINTSPSMPQVCCRGQIRFSVGPDCKQDDGGDTRKNPSVALCHTDLAAKKMMHINLANNTANDP